MKKSLLILLLIAFIFPSVTLASWWNPFSWFAKSENNAQNIETSAPGPIVPEVAPDAKIKEKPIIQTVTVQDPALQKQTNDLIDENARLKIKIADLTAQLNNEKRAQSIVVTTPECTSSITAKPSVNEVTILPNDEKEIIFNIHTDSSCQIDGKQAVLKIFEQSEDGTSYYLPTIIIPLVGSIKTNSTWKNDTLYSKNFVRENAGKYTFSFTFEGQQIIVPISIRKGIP